MRVVQKIPLLRQICFLRENSVRMRIFITRIYFFSTHEESAFNDIPSRVDLDVEAENQEIPAKAEQVKVLGRTRIQKTHQ